MPHTQICANAACASFSRWCLRTGTCCRLPAVLDGAQPHTSAHLAYAQAELVRPWPIGTLPWLPGNAPHSSDVCEDTFFSAARLKAKTLEAARGDVPAHSAAQLPLSFWDHWRLALSDVNASSKTYSAPMQLEDLVVGYDYRHLQTSTHVHTCIMGDCVTLAGQPCKWGLPCEKAVEIQYLDDETSCIIPVRRHLHDDRWLKVHMLSLLIRWLAKIQTNMHHPAAANKALLYSIKYTTKPEPHTRGSWQNTDCIQPWNYSLDSRFRLWLLMCSAIKCVRLPEKRCSLVLRGTLFGAMLRGKHTCIAAPSRPTHLTNNSRFRGRYYRML